MRSYSVTDVGQKRKINQDYVFVSQDPIGNLPNLFVVADGMGGHNAGDFASSFAVQVMLESVRNDSNFNPIKVIRAAMENANIQVYLRALRDENMIGMGTTMVAVTIVGEYAYVANVGDSRLYVIDKDIRQITRDHSLVEEMVRLGEISPEEAMSHPDRHIITRALGVSETVDIDFFDFKLQKDSKIVMCSDGLTTMVSDSEIRDVIHSDKKTDEKVQFLVDEANENGGKDNIAVIIIEPYSNEV